MLRTLFSRKSPEPSYPELPYTDESGQSNIPGIYIIGELAGTPLVKLGLNAGHDLIQRIGPELTTERGDHNLELLDLAIVGSGSSGFAATVAAADLGLRTVTLEASAFANTFATMTKGKWLFAEPHATELRSRVWFEECAKEELLERWKLVLEREKLEIRTHEKVLDVKGSNGDFTVTSDCGEYRAKRVILCMGKAGNPRTLGIPGEKEHAERIHHRLLDADDFTGQHILIVGAGDVACEAAIALANNSSNTVTLSAIDHEFVYPKKRNIDAIRELEDQGKLRVELASSVTGIDTDTAHIQLGSGDEEDIRSDSVFEMIGAELPTQFLRRVGLGMENSWDYKRWLLLCAVFIGVYSIYSLKSYGKGITAFPFEDLISPEHYDSWLRTLFDLGFAPFEWLFSEVALSDLRGDRGFQQGYLYSGLYTVIMLVFGYQALVRWRSKARHPSYQTWRYISLLGFQVGFFILVNIIGVQALSTKYAWRAWGLYQPYPLFFNTFFWWYPGDPVWIIVFFVVAGLLGTFVGIPILARNHGKRFCTWICGCGGLAETLGDRWRHLSPKGERSRAWEFQAVVIFFASVIVLLVVTGIYNTDGNNLWWHIYSYFVDFWLVAVIPIALYPFFGGKIWCRYWCPLAAYNQLLSQWYGRLKIVSNDKCITCTECSKYCQVGVDVMAFAKNEQPFDNTNSACIHCGICIDVCPMDVLSFEASTPKASELVQIGKSSGLA